MFSEESISYITKAHFQEIAFFWTSCSLLLCTQLQDGTSHPTVEPIGRLNASVMPPFCTVQGLGLVPLLIEESLSVFKTSKYQQITGHIPP